MNANTDKNNNTAIGYQALKNNDATRNIAIGASAMSTTAPITGDENIAIGNGTMTNITSGTGNIALGHSALEKNNATTILV